MKLKSKADNIRTTDTAKTLLSFHYVHMNYDTTLVTLFLRSSSHSVGPKTSDGHQELFRGPKRSPFSEHILG